MTTQSAGELDRSIQLQHNSPNSSNDYGEPIASYSTYAIVWAKMDFHRSGEGAGAAREYASYGLFFTIRYRADVLAEDRIVFEANNYQILGRPRELGRREWLMIEAKLVE